MLRIATLDDREDVLRLAKEFFLASPYAAVTEFDEEEALALIHTVLQSEPQQSVALLALQEGTPVGMIAGSTTVLPFSKDKVAFEIAWWVSPDYRKSRSAIELKKAYEYWATHVAKAKIIQLALLEGMTETEGVKKLYSRSGFKKIEEAYAKVLI